VGMWIPTKDMEQQGHTRQHALGMQLRAALACYVWHKSLKRTGVQILHALVDGGLGRRALDERHRPRLGPHPDHA